MSNPFRSLTENFAISLGSGPATGIVVDVNDPKKLGRVKIRLSMQHDIPVDKLPWCSVAGGTDNPMFRGIGKSHRLLKGAKVLCQQLDDQQIIITSTYGNSKDSDDPTADNHPLHKKKTKEIASRDYWGNDAWKDFDSSPKGVTPEDTRKVNNPGGKQTNKTEGDPVKEAGQNAKPPSRFEKSGKGFKAFAQGQNKHSPLSIAGFDKNAGDLTDVVKYIKSTVGDKGELIKGSMDMIEKIHSFAKAGTITDATSSVGGAQALATAVSSVLQIAKNNSGANQSELESLLERLYRIYREITGQEPLDEDGNQTVHFKEWKDEYLRAIS
jgi:hypothetical protein